MQVFFFFCNASLDADEKMVVRNCWPGVKGVFSGSSEVCLPAVVSWNEREISSSCREGRWTSIYYILGMYAIDRSVGWI